MEQARESLMRSDSRGMGSPTRQRTIANAGDNKHMPLKDKLILGPMEKYKLYNRFPWKLMLSLFIVAFSTAQVQIIIKNTGDQSRAQEIVFYHMFMDSEENYNGDIPRYKNLFNLTEVNTLINASVTNYYGINTNDTLEDYEYFLNSTNEIWPPVLFIEYSSNPAGQKTPLQFQLYQHDFGPFNTDNIKNGTLKKQLQDVFGWSIQYRVKQRLPEEALAETNCYDWTVNQKFKFSQRSTIRVELSFITYPCAETDDLQWNRHVWIHIAVLVLSITHFCLTIRYLYEIGKRYEKLKIRFEKQHRKYQEQGAVPPSSPKNQHDDKLKKISTQNLLYIKGGFVKQPQDKKEQIPILSQNFMMVTDAKKQRQLEDEGAVFSDDDANDINSKVIDQIDINEFFDKSKNKRWHELTFWEKLSIFNYWSILYLMSSFCLITGTLIFMFIRTSALDGAEVFIGFGCFFAWCTLPSYLHQTAQYSLITRTISFTLPMVLRAMTGIVPVFFGFAFLGLCLFWDSTRFQSISYSMFTCFAMMNGDSLYDIFYDISVFRYLFAQLFMYVFIFCGIVIVQNVFLIMIEHGFLGIKYAKSYQWLHEKYKDQVQQQQIAQFQNQDEGQQAVFDANLLRQQQSMVRQNDRSMLADDKGSILNLNDSKLTNYQSKNELRKQETLQVMSNLIEEEENEYYQ